MAIPAHAFGRAADSKLKSLQTSAACFVISPAYIEDEIPRGSGRRRGNSHPAAEACVMASRADIGKTLPRATRCWCVQAKACAVVRCS